MKVLVTGGAGFVGSHACKALKRAGFEPVVYDNLSRGHAHAVQWGPLERGDVLDAGRLDEVMRKHRPEAVLHFAALAYVGESFACPETYYRINVEGVWTLLEAMRRNGVGRLIFSSSCAVYGNVADGVCTEATPIRPISPYGASKSAAEQLIALHGAAHGLAWTALRYFNAAGADPDGDIGENHEPETHLIPLAIAAATGGEPLSLLGDDYPTRDGSAERDYVHVSDLADAHVLALRRLIDGGDSLALNLSTGASFSVLEICASVERVVGRPPVLLRRPRRPGDPPSVRGGGRLAGELLGWTPSRSTPEQMVRDAAAWLERARAQRIGAPGP